jgi:hypothetical protein
MIHLGRLCAYFHVSLYVECQCLCAVLFVDGCVQICVSI